MTNKEIFNLNIGDKIKYGFQIWELKDWKCHKEPLFDKSGNRIDAEPILGNQESRFLFSYLDWSKAQKV